MAALVPSLSDLEQCIVTQFPGRTTQARRLLQYLGQPDDPSPPFLFLYGPESTGKTSLARTVLAGTSPATSTAYVNCIERYTPRLIFDHILAQFSGSNPCYETGFFNRFQCNSTQEFVTTLAREIPIAERHRTRYIVFDNAERLRDVGSNFLPAFLRIGELTGIALTIILISNVIWDKFRPRGGLPEPLLLRFPVYTKEDTLAILSLECPADEPQDFFLSFTGVVYDVFSRNCKDINELRHLVALLFPKFREPVLDGRARRTEIPKLFRLCQGYFAAATDKLYLREISSTEWFRHINTGAAEGGSDSDSEDHVVSTDPGQLKLVGRLDFELPYYAKFLLIASFLASYNPARLDVRYFAKGRENTSNTKRGKQAVQKQMMTQTGGKQRQQLLGPKAFPLERMLAIFYSILDDPIENSIEIQSQIASLVTLRLLVRTSNTSQLDGVKVKCNVSYDLIRRVGRSIHFEIDRYLFDFV